MSSRQTRDVRRYYFKLYLWTQFNQQFRAFSGVEAHTIHRSLIDFETGAFGPETIHGLLASYIAAPCDALDAGCGYGGTCLDLYKRLGGRWHGITLSRRQTSIAKRNASAMGVSRAVTFATASYDDPLAKSYDLVFGIESLIHSVNPAHTIANLAAGLRKNGRMIIVDDMPGAALEPEHERDLAEFKRLWRCPEMPGAPQWQEYLKRAGCAVEEVLDLSERMRPRNAADLAAARADINARSWWRKYAGLQSVTEAEIGGLLLEGLGRSGAVRYQMIVARKI